MLGSQAHEVLKVCRIAPLAQQLDPDTQPRAEAAGEPGELLRGRLVRGQPEDEALLEVAPAAATKPLAAIGK